MGLRMTLLLLLQVPQKGTKNDDFGKTFVKMKQQNKQLFDGSSPGQIIN